MRAYVYVDGLNLFHRRLKGGPFKWLDLGKLCGLLMPVGHDVVAIKYFTARVNPMPWDPSAPQRQDPYLAALRTVPNLTIHTGQFKTRPKWMPLVRPCPHCGDKAEIWRTDEKGSDVALATHLLVDAHENRYDVGWIISKDTDLRAAVNAARHVFRKKVGIVIPEPTGGLNLFDADYYEHIRDSSLKLTQFPPKVKAADKVIFKPKEWP